MKKTRRARLAGRICGFRGVSTRVIVLGAPPVRRKALSASEAKLWAAQMRRSYAGLLIGVGVGLALVALLFLSD